jgi:MFS family permease
LVLQPTIPVAVALVTWGVAGLGMGLAYAPLSLVVLREAAPGEEGIATSGLQLSDVLGTALGTGVGGAFIAAGERAGVDGWVGLALAFGVGATVAVAGSLVATRIRPGLSERAREPLPTPGT